MQIKVQKVVKYAYKYHIKLNTRRWSIIFFFELNVGQESRTYSHIHLHLNTRLHFAGRTCMIYQFKLMLLFKFYKISRNKD